MAVTWRAIGLPELLSSLTGIDSKEELRMGFSPTRTSSGPWNSEPSPHQIQLASLGLIVELAETGCQFPAAILKARNGWCAADPAKNAANVAGLAGSAGSPVKLNDCASQ